MDHSFISTMLTLLSIFYTLQIVHCGSDSGMFLNREAFLPTNIKETKSRLISLMHVSCTPHEGIDISFNRRSLMELGVVYADQLQLTDPLCGSIGNETHFFLHTAYMGCGTLIKFSDDQTTAVIENKVLVSPPDSYFDDEDEGDAGGDGNKPLEISFKCTYNNRRRTTSSDLDRAQLPDTTTHAQVPDTPSVSRAKMELFRTDSYTRQVDVETEPVTRGTSLYVKIEAVDGEGSNQNFLIESCYLSNLPHLGSRSTLYYLIENGCASDRDVQFKDDTSSSPRKFLFRARRLYGNKPTYLHCSILPCGLGSNQQQCSSQQSYCRSHQAPQTESLFNVTLNGGMSIIKRTPVVAVQAPPPSTAPPTTQRAIITAQRKPAILTPKQPANNCAPTRPCICKSEVVELPSTSNEKASNSTAGMISITTMILVAGISFVIGMGLVGILWFVYTRTDPRRKMQTVAMSDDSSSSQESSVPNDKLVNYSDPPTSYESTDQ